LRRLLHSDDHGEACIASWRKRHSCPCFENVLVRDLEWSDEKRRKYKLNFGIHIMIGTCDKLVDLNARGHHEALNAF
jgi:hypothetical protein